MMTLTNNQKFAIITILSEIMNADGVIHPNEEEFMDKVYVELGITIGDLEDITNIDNIQAKAIIREMSDEQKQYARSLFVSMAKSDGYEHPKETVIIAEIFNG